MLFCFQPEPPDHSSVIMRRMIYGVVELFDSGRYDDGRQSLRTPILRPFWTSSLSLTVHNIFGCCIQIYCEVFESFFFCVQNGHKSKNSSTQINLKFKFVTISTKAVPSKGDLLGQSLAGISRKREFRYVHGRQGFSINRFKKLPLVPVVSDKTIGESQTDMNKLVAIGIN